MADTEHTVPILLLGDPETGKSTFLHRLTSPSSTTPQALPSHSQPATFTLRAPLPALRLEFSTPSSPTPYTTLRPSVIILCFSIGSRATLRAVQARWKREVETHFNYDERLPVLLLGLQRDLRREGDAQCVWPHEGLNVAQEMRCDRYAECSAGSGELCALVMEDVVRMAVGTVRAGGGKSVAEYCVAM